MWSPWHPAELGDTLPPAPPQDPNRPYGVVVRDIPLMVDQSNGSLYRHVLTVWNNGTGAAKELTVRLNLPGVPLLAIASRNETRIEVEPVTLRVVEARGNTTVVSAPVSRDPLALKAPELPFRWKDVQMRYEGRWVTLTEPLLNEWMTWVVDAEGSEWVTYVLPSLPSGGEWTLATFYFGHRTAPEAGGRFTAGAPDFANVNHYRSAHLTAFDAAGRPPEAHLTGAAPWEDQQVTLCEWPTDPRAP